MRWCHRCVGVGVGGTAQPYTHRGVQLRTAEDHRRCYTFDAHDIKYACLHSEFKPGPEIAVLWRSSVLLAKNRLRMMAKRHQYQE